MSASCFAPWCGIDGRYANPGVCNAPGGHRYEAPSVDDPFDNTVPTAPVEWTDWRLTPAQQATEQRAALTRLVNELEGFLDGTPADDPDVATLRRDLATCRDIIRNLVAPIASTSPSGGPR